eukprot:5405327-Pleurochrysis_carterae.AAC.1
MALERSCESKEQGGVLNAAGFTWPTDNTCNGRAARGEKAALEVSTWRSTRPPTVREQEGGRRTGWPQHAQSHG